MRVIMNAIARPLLCLGFLSLVSLVGAAGCSAQSGDEPGVDTTDGDMSQELTSSRTVGNWKDFPNGEQCYAAIQNFYRIRFGATVPHSSSGSGACRAGGACDLWMDEASRPSAAEWERIPNDGHHLPQTYDMIVYGPPAGEDYGHVASVDHVEGKTIYVIDDNYVGHLEKASRPHTVWVNAYGWYHLKSLGSESGGSTADCVPTGYYCGGDKVSGDKDDLYRCDSNGSSATKVETCKNGCQVRDGRDDDCK
jgi:hypothetical protein